MLSLVMLWSDWLNGCSKNRMDEISEAGEGRLMGGTRWIPDGKRVYGICEALSGKGREWFLTCNATCASFVSSIFSVGGLWWAFHTSAEKLSLCDCQFSRRSCKVCRKQIGVETKWKELLSDWWNYISKSVLLSDWMRLFLNVVSGLKYSMIPRFGSNEITWMGLR